MEGYPWRRHTANPESATASSASEAGSGTPDGEGTGLPIPGLRAIENSSASGNDGSISNDGSAKAEAKFPNELPDSSDADALKETSRISSDWTGTMLLIRTSDGYE